jgi:hypothetical protein
MTARLHDCTQNIELPCPPMLEPKYRQAGNIELRSLKLLEDFEDFGDLEDYKSLYSI